MSKEQQASIQWDDENPLEGFLVQEEDVKTKDEVQAEEPDEKTEEVSEEEELEVTDDVPEEEPEEDTTGEGEPEEDSEEVEEAEIDNHKVALQTLHDLGVIDLKEDDVLDDITLQDKIEEKINQGVMDQFNNMANSLSDESYKLVDHLLNGGDWRDFAGVLDRPSSKAFSVDNEDSQKDFLKYYYMEVEGKSEKRAEREISFLEDDETLEDEAKDLYQKLQKAEEELVKQESTKKAQEKKKKLEAAQKRERSIRQGLKSLEEYQDLSFSTRDKRLIERDILKKTELNEETGKYETKLTAMLRDAFSDANKLAALDYVLRNDFKLDIVKKKGATEEISKTEKTLQRKTPPKTKKSKSPKTQTPLWEQLERTK